MYTIGIDVGGTNLVAGVVDAEGRLLAKAKTPTPPDDGDPQPIVDACVNMAWEACDAAGVEESDILGIGFGLPGSVDKSTGDVIYCCNIPFVNVPLRRLVQAQWDIPVFVENDANAAALGEAVAGSAKGCKDVLFITLGTGVGGGIIIDGKVYSGFNDVGGELGHTVIVHDGVLCGCGRKGCWESYASATALIRYTRDAMAAHPDSVMWQLAKSLDRVNGKTAFDAMRAGDDAARDVVSHYIEMLACGLCSMVNILQPEVVCVGGGIANEGDILLKPLAEIVHRDNYNKTDRKTSIRKAVLGNDAGVIGAALCAR